MVEAPITLRRSTAEDRPAILTLMNAARNDDLTPEQRAQRGFVQGRMTEDILAHFQAGTGVFLAERPTELAGFAMTSLPGMVTEGPPKLALDALDGSEQPRPGTFLYGPTAVDPAFQGRGVLTALLITLSRALARTHDRGVAFVEEQNQKSLDIHRHYGMTDAASFTFRDRPYRVFTFSPVDFAARPLPRNGTFVIKP